MTSPSLDGEGEVVDGGVLAVVLGQAFDFNHGGPRMAGQNYARTDAIVKSGTERVRPPIPECGRFRPAMCGVVGVYGHPEAANFTYLGLHALQHRGQESAGIVSTDGETLHAPRDMGLVADIFTADRLERLPGRRRHRPRPLLDHRRLVT